MELHILQFGFSIALAVLFSFASCWSLDKTSASNSQPEDKHRVSNSTPNHKWLTAAVGNAEDENFFNGWKGDDGYWWVKDGAIVTQPPSPPLGMSKTEPALRRDDPPVNQPVPAGSSAIITADGLNIEPFAADQLSNPASIDVDDRGRVWVAEALNYRKKNRQQGDRILILQDSDGDGRADSTKVFYQNPDIDGVHGVCVLGNQAIVSVSDRIIVLTDTDGDDKADKKKLLFKGKVVNGVEGQHDHAIHAVMFGPDGRLYFNFGNFNAELRRADGTLVTDVFGHPVDNSRQPYQEGMVIRCELDGSRVEVLGHNFRNNWEVTVDSFGSMWQSDNDNGSSSCRVNFVMEYGNYGYRDEKTGADYGAVRTNIETTMQRRMWHQNDPGVVPNLLITGSGAPTGILVYEGELLPAPFQGQMIHAETGRNRVWAFPTERQGAGYSARIVDLAHSNEDRDYRPSDISVAPDGSLLIADWFDPVDCCHRTINDAGRIFRVAPAEHPYTVPLYDYQTPEGAIRALRSPNLSARYGAWTALVKMQARARPALETMATDPNPRFRARALWVLAALSDGADGAIEMALSDESDEVRALALRMARRHRLPVEPIVKRLVRDESALVRRECAVSLHRLDSPESVQLWVDLAGQYDGTDRWYLEALGIGEVGKEAACLDAWLTQIGDPWKAPAGRDIVWRSRAPAAAQLLAGLLLDPDVPATEHPRLLRALDFHPEELRQAAVNRILQADAGNPATYLEAFQRATAEFLAAHPEVAEQIESTLVASKGTVTFVDLVARFDRRDMIGHLMDMAQANPEQESGIRAVGQVISFQQWGPIWNALADPQRATPFIKALGYVGNEHSRNYLLGVVTNESQPEATRRLAIAAMGQTSIAAQSLMKLVQDNGLPKEYLASAIAALTLSPDPNTRTYAAEQRDLLVPAEARWPLEKLLATQPDISKGFAAFEKADCIKCHKIGNQGKDFGPDLSTIGSKLTAEQLFQSILDPNETISLGYEGVKVLTYDGVLHSGFVSAETEDTLSLRIPGGLQKQIPKTDIDSRKLMTVSTMPTGIDAVLTPQELVNVVGWLGTHRAANSAEPQQDSEPGQQTTFFNGKDLTGWKGNAGYWSVQDGAIVGHSEKDVPKNEFIWSDIEVRDFHLVVDVKLTPDDRNAGIQFRSQPMDATGQAQGYQADVGHDPVIGNVWGNLYHEHGRGKLDWNDRAVKVLKKGDWNRYEILAVGHRIWTSVNGELCTAIEDADGELSGKIAFQIHSGEAQTVLYRNPTLTHNPKIALEKHTTEQLLAALHQPNLPELLAASIHGSPNVDITVPKGTYTLQLLLYEGWRSRSADIVIEGKTVKTAYDMFKEQGENFDHGSVLRHRLTLTDGNIDIEIKGPLHLSGLILSKGKLDSPDRVEILKSQAALDLQDVIKAINFGDTKDLKIGDVKFAAAAVNTTVDGVTNTADGDVYSGEFGQKLPQMQQSAELPKKELPYWSKLIAGIDPGSQAEAWVKPTFDHSKWKTMNLPGHFDTVELPGFDGVVWFRKSIELSGEQAKAAATLHLGQIDDMDVTWVNGTRVGGYENPGHHYTVRNYQVPAGVLKPGKNVIAVRVMDHSAPGGIAGQPEQLFLQLDDERISLANLWHFEPGANLAALNTYGQVPALVRPLSRPQTPVSAFVDGFAIDSDQTIAVVGGTNALESGRHGYLETLLTAAHPQHQVRVRNLAWQADTVYQQQRPRNFYAPNKPDYGERDSRAKIKADIVFFWMGQTESLDGPERLEEFKTAYEQHLDQISEYTQRVVLVTPIPFSNPLRLDIDIKRRNDSLAAYVDAIRKIGHRRNLPVVDLAESFGWVATLQTHSRNGMHLLPAGHWDVAFAFASQLGFADRVASIRCSYENSDGDPGLKPASAESLRQAIGRKNDLWFRYWRPTNWAFLYGNRQQTASSRDHTDPSRRWFPDELQKSLPRLVDAERRVHEAARESKQ